MNTTFENCTLLDTKTWFEKARPEPTMQHSNSQLGCHFEEVSEQLEQLEGNDLNTQYLIDEAYEAMVRLANYIKANSDKELVTVKSPVLYLDSLCDQIVTATGVAHTQGYDIVGAMTEVNRSNFSKFGEDGKPLFDENKKVIKGPLYSKAVLFPYLPR